MSRNELQKLLIECLATTHNDAAKAFALAISRAPQYVDDLRRIARALGIDIDRQRKYRYVIKLQGYEELNTLSDDMNRGLFRIGAYMNGLHIGSATVIVRDMTTGTTQAYTRSKIGDRNWQSI